MIRFNEASIEGWDKPFAQKACWWRLGGRSTYNCFYGDDHGHNGESPLVMGADDDNVAAEGDGNVE